jgi:carbon-monoxide dehydrogenase small subunit
MTVIAIEINNRKVSRDVTSRTHLADFVRDEGRQTGTHLACEHGVCGACTLLVEGQPVRSCIIFAVACDGKKVTTVEGYDDDAIMALLRPAFSRHHGLQCGFCTPGMLASARDIVLRFPNADEDLIRVELSGNLCRCTGYMGIVNAIMDVLAQCRDDAAPEVSKLRTAIPQVFKDVTVVAARAVAFQKFKATDIGKAAVVAEKQAAADDHNATAVKGGTNIQGSFNVPYPADAVWTFMADLPAVAGCLPGAELTEHIDDRVKGRVAIKFGPMSASFNGAARLDRNEQERSAVLKGAGQDSVSKSRANGDVSYRVVEIDANSAKVEVDLLYSLQGPLAQFSRSGLVKDFVGRLIQEFGKNVTRRMNPSRPSDLPLSPAQLSAFSLGMSVMWSRIKRFFGRGD